MLMAHPFKAIEASFVSTLAVQRQYVRPPVAARSKHSSTGWIELLPLLSPFAQVASDFQFGRSASWWSNATDPINPSVIMQEALQPAPRTPLCGGSKPTIDAALPQDVPPPRSASTPRAHSGRFQHLMRGLKDWMIGQEQLDLPSYNDEQNRKKRSLPLW